MSVPPDRPPPGAPTGDARAPDARAPLEPRDAAAARQDTPDAPHEPPWQYAELLDDLRHDETLLDEAFPLGDGTADDAGVVYCPYCGELADVALDAGGGAVQRYVEDCPVCCRPWQLTVRYDASGAASVECEPGDPS